MTTAPPPRTVVTDALVDMLGAVTMRPTWGPDGPDPTHNAYDLMPYLVVDLIGSGTVYGTVGAPEDMAEVVWQVTAVGETFTSAQIAMDRARTAILERDGTGDGFVNAIPSNFVAVTNRAWDSDAGTQVEGGVVNVAERFRFTCCILPATDDGVEGGVPGVEVDEVLDGGTP